MDLTNCALCEQAIIKGNSIYRAFDNTYCSNICLRKKCFSIDSIDPEHKIPTKWKEANCTHVINIPKEIEKQKEHRHITFKETSPSKLSIVQYSLLIASTFGIIGFKNFSSNNPNSLPLL